MSRRDVTLSLSVSVPGSGGQTQKLTTNLKMKVTCSEMGNIPEEYLDREANRLANELEQEMRLKEQNPTFWKDFARTLLLQVKAYDEGVQ